MKIIFFDETDFHFGCEEKFPRKSERFDLLFGFSPLGRMLLSFLNKDPISMAQRSGTTNDNTASNVSMHMINSTTSNNQTSARQNILPVMNKNEERIPLIERLSNRSLSQDEKELLNEIQVLFRSDATYSPILNKKHLTLLGNFSVSDFH